ncbi:hypothetical protein BaRGS_00002213, partial [Batillaria attramentaria]
VQSGQFSTRKTPNAKAVANHSDWLSHKAVRDWLARPSPDENKNDNGHLQLVVPTQVPLSMDATGTLQLRLSHPYLGNNW